MKEVKVIKSENEKLTPINFEPVETFQRKILWLYVLKYAFLHLCALYGMLLIVTTCKVGTIVVAYALGYLSALAVTAGSHRLWSHRSYKAKLPLRIILAFFQTMAFDKSIYDWCVDHRVHHKYSETTGDPHNIREGFFFSHIGWRMLSSHPDFLECKEKLDFTDLEEDPVVMFQRKYWIPLVFLCFMAIPTLIPYVLFGEDLITAFVICVTLRWFVSSHIKWTVNSIAHRWGLKPYDASLGNACENKLVVWLSVGEGFHNYHHTFPWDYKTSELDWRYDINLTAALIDLWAKMGQAYDLKTVSPDMIKQRKARTGDGFDPYSNRTPRGVLGYIFITVVFFTPLMLLIATNLGVKAVFFHVYGAPLEKNIHHFVLEYLFQIHPVLNNYLSPIFLP